MLKLFYALLVIEYVVEDQEVATSIIFPSEQECYDAMGDGVLDNLYDILADSKNSFASQCNNWHL